MSCIVVLARPPSVLVVCTLLCVIRCYLSYIICNDPFAIASHGSRNYAPVLGQRPQVPWLWQMVQRLGTKVEHSFFEGSKLVRPDKWSVWAYKFAVCQVGRAAPMSTRVQRAKIAVTYSNRRWHRLGSKLRRPGHGAEHAERGLQASKACIEEPSPWGVRPGNIRHVQLAAR